MISMVITVSGLNRIADMLDDEEHCLLLTKNDFHNIATACLDELDDSQHRPSPCISQDLSASSFFMQARAGP